MYSENNMRSEIMVNAIFSIKPQYAHALMDGTKKYEYRKKMPKRRINKIYVYSTAPDKKVIGYFTVKKIHQADPLKIWMDTWKNGCVSFDDYELYFQNNDVAYAIEVDEYFKYDTPKVYIKIDETNKVPRSIKYMKV